MSYDEVIDDVVKGVEAAGAGIMVLGGLGAFLLYLARLRGSDDASASYDELRRNLGRCILLGLVARSSPTSSARSSSTPRWRVWPSWASSSSSGLS